MRTAAVKGSPKYPLQRGYGLARPLGLNLNQLSLSLSRRTETEKQRVSEKNRSLI